MSNFYFPKYNATLIHIPKCGGSSIRESIFKREYRRKMGIIPQEWEDSFKFAFVRHPIERFLSAYRDFTQLRKVNMSINDFAKITCDDSIGYLNEKNLHCNIRHHTIPQTHSFNCLGYADFIGRYENYSQDLNYILKKLNIKIKTLPQIRKTSKHQELKLNNDIYDQLINFYKRDFNELNYSIK